MKMTEETRAIILLLVLIAIGGIVMYGQKVPTHTNIPAPTFKHATNR